MRKTDIKYDLYNILIFSMLKTDQTNCLKMYQSFKNKDILFFLYSLELSVRYLSNNNLITENMINNIHVLFNTISEENPELKYLILNSYNDVKKYIGKTKLDHEDLLLKDDIYIRYFGIKGALPQLIFEKKVGTFYDQSSKQIMDDIAFDSIVINYLLDDSLAEQLVWNSKFFNSIRYMSHLKSELFDTPDIKNKLKLVVSENEFFFTNKQRDKKLRKEHQKMKRKLK